MGNGYSEMLRQPGNAIKHSFVCEGVGVRGSVGGGGWGHAVGLIIYISVPAAITVMFMAHTVL